MWVFNGVLMLILHVAVFSGVSTNVWQADAFENLGHEVIRYDYRKHAVDLDGKLSNCNKNRDKHLIALCKEICPVLILFSKCNQMDISVVKECNEIGTTVLWYMDYCADLNRELKKKMKIVDYVFCSRWDGINEAVKHNENVYRLQGGYNPIVHRPFATDKLRDVTFIGTLTKNRLYYKKHIDFEVINGVYNEDHSRIVSSSKINLSFSEGDGISNRIYKLMAAKGFVLTQPWYKMEEDFIIGEHLDVFNSPQELRKKIDYYLKNEKHREVIAANGYMKVQEFDNVNYAQKILEIIADA